MKINVAKILENCSELNYIVLRNSEDLTRYPDGKDVDILAKDVPEMVKAITRGVSDYIFDGYSLEKKIDGNHIHLDLIKEGALLIRFDIIDTLTLNSTALVAYLLENKEDRDGVKYPNEIGDMFTRLLEYFDHPEKEQHLKTVEALYD